MTNKDDGASISTTLPATSFHRFADLPTEVRWMIWELCLPTRVIELNELTKYTVTCQTEDDEDVDVYGYPARYGELGCSLKATTRANTAPPAIAYVSREARHVAARVCGMRDDGDDTALSLSPQTPWLIHRDAIPHIYCRASLGLDDLTDEGEWTDGLYQSYREQVLSLTRLHEAIKPFHSIGSIDYMWFSRREDEGDCIQYEPNFFPDHLPGDTDDCAPRVGPPDPAEYPQTCIDIETFQRRPRWLCVIEVVVIHISHEKALASGLFGFLGDEPIQIVETSDCGTIDALYDLDNDPRDGHSTSSWRSYSRYKTWLKKVLWCFKFPNSIADRLQPAVMFRLCTKMCTPERFVGRSLAPC